MEYFLSILPIVVVGITLASLSIAQARSHRAEIHRLEAKMDAKFEALSAEIASLRERMAHLEGLMEGLREAITGRKAA